MSKKYMKNKISWTKNVGEFECHLGLFMFKIVKPKGRISSDLYMGDKVIAQHEDKDYLIDYANKMVIGLQ